MTIQIVINYGTNKQIIISKQSTSVIVIQLSSETQRHSCSARAKRSLFSRKSEHTLTRFIF